jgi:hypothetical protein
LRAPTALNQNWHPLARSAIAYQPIEFKSGSYIRTTSHRNPDLRIRPTQRVAHRRLSTTTVGLTHRGPGSPPGGPRVYYPTGVRNFARIVPSDDVQGAADALLCHRLGLRRLFVAYGGLSLYGIGIAQNFAQPAKRLGLGIAGTGQLPQPIGSTASRANLPVVAAFVHAIVRTHPDGVFLGGSQGTPPSLH